MTTYPEVHFHALFPAAVQPSVGALITEFLWLCPVWMQRIQVRFVDCDEFDAQWTLNHDYRHSTLELTNTFLTQSPEAQRETIAHEIFHCFTIPLKRVCIDALNDLEVEEKIGNIISRRINEVMEQVTQDFAYSIARKR